MTLEINRAPLLYHIKLCAPFQIHRWFHTWVTVRKRLIRVKIGGILSHVTLKCDGWPWQKNRTPLLYYIKLYASFQSHGWIQTVVTVRKRSIRVKIGIFLSRVTVKYDGGPWKTIGHLSNAVSSLVHYFIAIGEFKLEIQSGNAQFRSNLTIFLALWPWNLMDDLEKQ